jgi:AcrR family transcriptional regulator
MPQEDRRRAQGERTRRRVATRAAELASINGLSGLTLGQLASDLRIAKSSVAAAFRTKEELQLAAIATAADIFDKAVLAPTTHLAPGLPRLSGLIDAWLRYVAEPVFPGGCFMVATAAEFDSRPGPIRDALADLRRGWLNLLTQQVEHAAPTDLPPALLAFEIDALLSAANVAANLLGDTLALDTARRVLATRLGLNAS